MDESKLVDRLKSMKHYFFMDRGDWFSHFVDGAEDVLEQKVNKVKIEKLESLLELAIRTASTNSDPYKDDVECELSQHVISEQLWVTRLTQSLGPAAFYTGSEQNNATNNAPMRTSLANASL
jgi:gamma-tubulin complex component 2